jgi:hypothetical protein
MLYYLRYSFKKFIPTVFHLYNISSIPGSNLYLILCKKTLSNVFIKFVYSRFEVARMSRARVGTVSAPTIKTADCP